MATTKNRTVFTKFLSSSDLNLNTEQRTVGFSFSSRSNICERYGYLNELPDGSSVVFDEYLSHDTSAWDLTRVSNNTCPFLRNHVRGQKLGIVKDVVLDGVKGVALVKLSKNDLAQQFISDIEDGTSGGISFGYYVEEYKVISPAEYSEINGYKELIKKALLEATKIVLLEISSEDIPADPTVGYNKSAVNLTDVVIQGNPNFKSNPMDDNFKILESELLSTKSALADSISKQQILTSELNSIKSEYSKLSQDFSNLESSLQEKTAIISALEKRELVSQRYYDLRQKAESLVSEAKLSTVEFNELFSQVPSDDIQSHTKSQVDKLGHIDFHLDLIQKRSPLLNLQQSNHQDPVVDDFKPTQQELDSQAAKLLQSIKNSQIIL